MTTAFAPRIDAATRLAAQEAHDATLVPGARVSWQHRGVTMTGVIEEQGIESPLRRRVAEGPDAAHMLHWIVECQFLTVVPSVEVVS